MLKVVFFVHKRPDLDAEEFRRHWRETQGLLGAKIPGTRKYVQNHTIATPDGGTPAYDGFAEVWFDNQEVFEQGMATPEAQAAIADLPNFLDTERMQSLLVDEVDGDVPAAVEFGRVAAAPVNTLRQQPHRCQEISVCF